MQPIATIHSDQNWHYPHNQWVRTINENKVFQSMSHKATCAEYTSMGNFFGLMKQKMYHREALVSYEGLIRRIEAYIYWYNHEMAK